jgi:hypothetical protein
VRRYPGPSTDRLRINRRVPADLLGLGAGRGGTYRSGFTIGEPVDELVDDGSTQTGVGDEVSPLGSLDDKRGPAIEPIGSAAADAQIVKLFVAELPIHGRPLRPEPASLEAERARAKRQPPDEGLPVWFAPLDRVARHSSRKVGARGLPPIGAAAQPRCGKAAKLVMP